MLKNLLTRARALTALFVLALGLTALSPAIAQINLPGLPPLLPPPPAPASADKAPPAPAAPAPLTAPAKAGAKAAGPAGSVKPPPAPGASPAPVCGPVPAPPRIARTHGGSTNHLIETVTPLVQHGLSPAQAMILTTAPFPVAGLAHYSDDWQMARTTPCPHLHQGNDIFADFGTPIVASGPGVISSMGTEAVGGIAMYVNGDDGNAFYYAHLKRFAKGVRSGMRVDKGTVLGEVGNTGNADGGPPHLHFEVHAPVRSRSGTYTAAINPINFLNSSLTEAEEGVTAVITGVMGGQVSVPSVLPAEAASLTGLNREIRRDTIAQGRIPAYQTDNRGIASLAQAMGFMALLTMMAVFGVSARLWRSQLAHSKRRSETSPPLTNPRRQLI